MHEAQYLHRDIKPDNFLMGVTKQTDRVLYVIDFGLTKRYIDKKTGIHIKCTDGKPMTGTARYASINAHLGFEQSRRDDLEAIGYMLVYFLKGSLPWQGLGGKNKKEKYDNIKDKKQNTPIELLCKGLPAEFADYIKITRGLKFEEQPNYKELKAIFSRLLIKNQLVDDKEFDWFVVKQVGGAKAAAVASSKG